MLFATSLLRLWSEPSESIDGRLYDESDAPFVENKVYSSVSNCDRRYEAAIIYDC